MGIKSLLKFSFLLILGLFAQPLLAQEDILKSYAEDKNLRKFCFYPSTLRMVNLDNNPDFNELVGGIDKLLIYTLDSSATASKDYVNIIKEYEAAGYEEYASMWGGTTLFLYGNQSALVGVFGNSETAAAFHMNGFVAVEKIPSLMETLEDNQLLNFFDLKTQRISRDQNKDE